MSEWWTYSLADFLMFSPRTWYRLIELYNRAIWPAQLVGVASGVVIVALLFGRRERRDQTIAALLAAAWLFTGWAFHYERYAQINWAAPWFAVAFAVEALLLVALGIVAGRLRFQPIAGRVAMIAAGLVGLIVVGYPLLAPFAGRPWTTAETFGVMPDPTALASVAALALLRGRVRWLLLVIPLLWCAIAAATWWTMATLPQ